MSKLSLLTCAGLLGLLAACGGYRTEATAPTVSYNYADDDDYDEIAEKADDYCDDHYDRDAYLVDTDETAGGYEATFSCR